MGRKSKPLRSMHEGPVDFTDSPDCDERFIPREDLPSMWDGPASFVLTSAEGTLTLRPERKLDVPAALAAGETRYADETDKAPEPEQS